MMGWTDGGMMERICDIGAYEATMCKDGRVVGWDEVRAVLLFFLKVYL